MSKVRFPSRREALGMVGLMAVGITSTRAQTSSKPPIRIGQTLSLTGPLAQNALIHRIAGEIFIDKINKNGGLLGRQIEYVLLDDQSKSDVTRTLYERLITSDKVDLIVAPYSTPNILAAMGIAQRYEKVFIQSTLGIPSMGTYDGQFASLVQGAEPEKTFPNTLFDAFASTAHPPKTAAIVTSKFVSAQFMAAGTREVFTARGLQVPLYLEYDFGTRDFAAIAARIKDADLDMLWMGALGVDGNLLLDALAKLDYKPRRHFYLFPAAGALAVLPAAEGALSLTLLEDAPPYTSKPEIAEFAREFNERAKKAGLPSPFIDTQAGQGYAVWQILAAAITATNSLEDAKLINWLKTNSVDTVVGKRDFSGKWHSSSTDQLKVKQVQKGAWFTVWPTADATPGAKLIEP